MPAPLPRPFHGSFEGFSTARGVKGETGYSDSVVQELWRKYGHEMPTAPSQGVNKAEAYFYAALKVGACVTRRWVCPSWFTRALQGSRAPCDTTFPPAFYRA